MGSSLRLLITALVVLSAHSVDGAPPKYKVQPVQGVELYGIFGMNNHGQIVGFGESGAAVWTPTTANGTAGTTFLMPGGESHGIAAAINDLGQIAGRRGASTAVLWNPTDVVGVYSAPVDLPVNGPGSAIATGINDFGQVVGRSGDDQSFLWTPSSPNGTAGTAVTLPPLPPADIGKADKINNLGQVAAWSGEAFLWQPTAPNGQMGAIHPIGAYQPTNGYSNLINNAGWIVGQNVVSNTNRAFVWRPTTPNGTSGSLTQLPALGGSAELYPAGLNDSGVIVGYLPANGDAFLWTSPDGTLNLDELLDASSAGWHISYATAINDLGYIFASGSYTPPGGGPIVQAAVLLAPVPEPTTLTAICLAWCGVVCACRGGRSVERRV